VPIPGLSFTCVSQPEAFVSTEGYHIFMNRIGGWLGRNIGEYTGGAGVKSSTDI
jgi:hypothetical protein